MQEDVAVSPFVPLSPLQGLEKAINWQVVGMGLSPPCLVSICIIDICIPCLVMCVFVLFHLGLRIRISMDPQLVGSWVTET